MVSVCPGKLYPHTKQHIEVTLWDEFFAPTTAPTSKLVEAAREVAVYLADQGYPALGIALAEYDARCAYAPSY